MGAPPCSSEAESLGEGAKVTVHEAHHTLGGRARTNEGPHALYNGGPHWAWLRQRDLIGPLAPLPPLEAARLRLRHQGVLRRTPPFAMLKLLRRTGRQAPVDADFLTWATDIAGEEGARAAALPQALDFARAGGSPTAAVIAAVSPARPPPMTVMRCMAGDLPRVGIAFCEYDRSSALECDITGVRAGQSLLSVAGCSMGAWRGERRAVRV